MNLDRYPFWRARASRNVIVDAWSGADADLVVVERPTGPIALALGDDAGVAALIDTHLPAGLAYVVASETLWPHLSEATRAGLRRGEGWDWMWTSTMPAPHPGEGQVRVLDAESEQLVPAVVAAGYPNRWDGADDTGATFFGYYDKAEVLAGVFAVHTPDAGTTDGAYLAGLAVLPSHRRQGVGSALTVACTRWSLERWPMAHLGVYQDNPTALKLYLGLGYEVGMAIENLFPLGR